MFSISLHFFVVGELRISVITLLTKVHVSQGVCFLGSSIGLVTERLGCGGVCLGTSARFLAGCSQHALLVADHSSL